VHIAIIGLPNSTKTTIFNALTRGHSETASYSSGKFSVGTGVVPVPDQRVDRLTAMFKPRKTAYAQVTYADISGLDKGVGKGGLTGSLLNALSESDALLHVVRVFEDASVPHSEGSIDPQRDIAIVDLELLLSDLGIVEKRIERLHGDLARGGAKVSRATSEAELELLQRVQAHLAAEQPLRDMDMTPPEMKMLRNFGLLTLKPLLIVLNVGDRMPADVLAQFSFYQHKNMKIVALQGRLEMELAQMSPEEAAEFMPEYGITELGLDRVISVSYELLGQQSFFTVGEDEVRAWTITAGAAAVDAAGVIHTDLAKGFIRAEVISYDDLIAAGTMVIASQRGKLRLEGRDYVVKDGDILNIRFNI
jgi:ribosome-binding ATPase